MFETYSIENTDTKKFPAMAAVAIEYGHKPFFRDVAAQITSPANGYQLEQIADGICSWIRQKIRYFNEAGEMLQTPLQTLRVAYGDCDDLVMLAGALVVASGMHFQFVPYGGTPAQHVAIKIWLGDLKGWKEYELTR